MTTTTSMRSIDLSKNPSDVELYVSHPTVLERPVFLPKAPVPQKKLPYRVYGYVGLKEAQRKHQLLASSISCMAFASPSYAVQAEAVGYAVERALFCRCVCKTADFDLGSILGLV